MLKYIQCFVLLFAVSAIKCENCVTYDFGTDFYNSFNNGNSLCDGMANWQLGNYSSLDIESPHLDSESFVTPDDKMLSCVSSFIFEMVSDGIVEVYAYMESNSERDQIVVFANEVSSSENVVTGTAMLSPLTTDYYNGWHVLKINLVNTRIFNGYLTFLGLASPGSTVLIDSFRYIPPQYGDDCHVYEEDFVTTNPLDTEPTTPEPTQEEECVTYNFETEFDNLFNNYRGLCTGFTQWSIGTYSSLPIDTPSSLSHQFISPQNGVVSCASSFDFQAGAGGIVEVNIYMESAVDTDQIAVLVNKIENEANDVVTGSAVITPFHESYVDGWQVVRIVLTGEDNYNGYISFFGVASEESIVLIDSFRYIPPSLTREECKIYEDEVFETTTAVPVGTVPPIGTGQDCVTYNFESNFDISFNTDNVLCNGYSSWNLGDYYSLGIGTIDPDSRTFISPNETSSCVSSFIFRMIPGGKIEVNAYMKSASDLDYIIVLAKKVVPSGIDTVAGLELYYATSDNFVEGWNVLKVTVNDFSTFDGYITLIGSTAEDSIVLIDSFRYIPPDTEVACEIY